MQHPSPGELDRVVVVGTSCSGKTTFARQLSQLLQTGHIEIDALHWKEDWEARAPAELRLLVEEAVSQERWIVDGNYGIVREVIWPRATAETTVLCEVKDRVAELDCGRPACGLRARGARHVSAGASARRRRGGALLRPEAQAGVEAQAERSAGRRLRGPIPEGR